VWAAVVITLASLVLNLATGARWERRIWVPVLLVMNVSALAVALGP
jgi:hypothetical protein